MLIVTVVPWATWELTGGVVELTLPISDALSTVSWVVVGETTSLAALRMSVASWMDLPDTSGIGNESGDLPTVSVITAVLGTLPDCGSCLMTLPMSSWVHGCGVPSVVGAQVAYWSGALVKPLSRSVCWAVWVFMPTTLGTSALLALPEVLLVSNIVVSQAASASTAMQISTTPAMVRARLRRALRSSSSSASKSYASYSGWSSAAAEGRCRPATTWVRAPAPLPMYAVRSSAVITAGAEGRWPEST